jgi:hypothetical protein
LWAHKNTFTAENWVVKRHSKKEFLEAREKRKKYAATKKAKKLGRKTLVEIIQFG